MGFSVDISKENQLKKNWNFRGKNLYEWESQYWVNRVEPSPLSDEIPMYWADINTTMCVYRKDMPDRCPIRVAGPYTCEHLPWYIDNPKFDFGIRQPSYK
jgi:hypothetical protein